MTHRFNWFLLALAIIIGLPAYWLLIDNRIDPLPPKPLAIGQLRDLAAAMPGTAPSRVEVEIVASRSAPQTLFAAGSGFKYHRISAMAFRLPVAGGKAIVIDSGMTARDAKDTGYSWFNATGQQRVDQATRDAALILVTHEHADHMGGLAAMAGEPEVMKRARLNPAQINDGQVVASARWPASNRPVASLRGTEPVAVAPGVVVIPAPDSHTPGSQMIFVRLADGREYLFTGDIAMLAVNWQQLRLRSRLMSEHVAPSNRREVHAWLQAIKALKKQAPDLVIVPGHDFNPLTHYQMRNRAERGFIGQDGSGQ